MQVSCAWALEGFISLGEDLCICKPIIHVTKVPFPEASQSCPTSPLDITIGKAVDYTMWAAHYGCRVNFISHCTVARTNFTNCAPLSCLSVTKTWRILGLPQVIIPAHEFMLKGAQSMHLEPEGPMLQRTTGRLTHADQRSQDNDRVMGLQAEATDKSAGRQRLTFRTKAQQL